MNTSSALASCRICSGREVVEILNAGPHAIGNRFLTESCEDEYEHPLVLGQCMACGILQIIRPVPSAELVPRFDWITYHEPEQHLDHFTDVISRLPRLTSESRLGGISFKDESTLDRLRARGFKNTWALDLSADLGVHSRGAGVETIQSLLTPEKAEQVVQKHGLSDLLVVRHILEHAHDPARFLEALRKMLKPQGYLVFEVPDCARALDLCDYTTLWEEHTLYFTKETFLGSLSQAGFELIHSGVYPYPFENSLVAIARAGKGPASAVSGDVLAVERERGRRFAGVFTEQKEYIRQFFTGFKKREGKIAFLGAGHLTGTFINLFGIRDAVECVIDDNPNKQGLLMPGSQLPIRSSQRLQSGDIRLVLLGVNPLSESKVIQKLQNFKDQGGLFRSLFPASKLWFLQEKRAGICR